MYELRKPSFKDKKRLLEFKLELTNKTIDEKLKYKKVKKDLNYRDYYLIIIENDIAGCLLIKKNTINEIYIIPKYRNMGIASEIIKDVINTYKETYLWVFKDNKEAINLYKKLGFKVIKENELSYYMRVLKYGVK